MEIEKVDRRVKYTKVLLKKSLVELMNELPISKVSVKMLCERADVNRSTFYAHYTDQYDLLSQLEREVVAELNKHISKDAFSKQTEQTAQAINRMLTYVSKNPDLFQVLLSENGDSNFQKEIMLLVQQQTILDILNDNSIDKRTSEYMQCFIITGALSILQKWLQNGMSESTEDMTELIYKLLYNGTSAFYKNR